MTTIWSVRKKNCRTPTERRGRIPHSLWCIRRNSIIASLLDRWCFIVVTDSTWNMIKIRAIGYLSHAYMTTKWQKIDNTVGICRCYSDNLTYFAVNVSVCKIVSACPWFICVYLYISFYVRRVWNKTANMPSLKTGNIILDIYP